MREYHRSLTALDLRRTLNSGQRAMYKPTGIVVAASRQIRLTSFFILSEVAKVLKVVLDEHAVACDATCVTSNRCCTKEMENDVIDSADHQQLNPINDSILVVC